MNTLRLRIRCFLANMNNTPLVVENQATLTVVDRRRVKYKIKCYISLIKKKDNGESVIVDTANPMVLKTGSDTEFIIITEKTQAGMEFGGAIREAFDRGSHAKCHITLNIKKVGLLKRQKFRSPSIKFLTTERTNK